jgi:chromosome segregation ATPase
VTALAATGYALLPDGKKSDEVKDPADRPFNKEESRKEIVAAISQIDAERAKQIHLRDQILHSFQEEQNQLQQMQQRHKKVNEDIEKLLKEPEQTGEEHTRKLYQLNQEYRRLEKSIQEQTEFVDTLRKNADGARLLDFQHEQKMTKLRDEYQKILEKLDQIERSEKVAQMQEALQRMEGQNGAAEKLEEMQDKVETRYHASLAAIQETLTEAKALEASMACESALLQEKLKERSEKNKQEKSQDNSPTT